MSLASLLLKSPIKIDEISWLHFNEKTLELLICIILIRVRPSPLRDIHTNDEYVAGSPTKATIYYSRADFAGCYHVAGESLANN